MFHIPARSQGNKAHRKIKTTRIFLMHKENSFSNYLRSKGERDNMGKKTGKIECDSF
jgi:hypothetical protein